MKNHRNKKCYQAMEAPKQKIFLEKKVRDMKNKQEIQKKLSQKYKTMDTGKKQELLIKKAQEYKTMDAPTKQKVHEKRKQNYIARNKTLDSCTEEFNRKIKEGSYYICCICNRTLYKKSVLKPNKPSYPSQDIFNILLSFDGKEHICKTCHSKASQGSLPCQAIVNNFYVDDISTELEDLKKLEQIIIAQRIVFEKIIVMPKKQQRKIKGAICDVPVNCN